MTKRQKEHIKARAHLTNRGFKLSEQIKKLNMEKDMLLNKNKKLVCYFEKRKSGRQKQNCSGRENEELKQDYEYGKAHNSTGKAKQEADMRYLKLRKTLESL